MNRFCSKDNKYKNTNHIDSIERRGEKYNDIAQDFSVPPTDDQHRWLCDQPPARPKFLQLRSRNGMIHDKQDSAETSTHK